jgi:hypothetical protein
MLPLSLSLSFFPLSPSLSEAYNQPNTLSSPPLSLTNLYSFVPRCY